MAAYAGDHIAQVCLGLDTVKDCRADQRIEQGGSLASGIGAAEQLIFSARAIGLIWFSAALLLISSLPSSR
jgi:hypothetical protein